MTTRRAAGLGIVGICLALAAGAAWAQSREKGPRESGPGGGSPPGQRPPGQRPPEGANRGGAPDAETLFQRLDVDGDGKLTMKEARPNERGLFAKIFEMAGQPESGSVSLEQFRTVHARHQRGENGPPGNPGPNGPRPGGPRPEGSRSEGSRPESSRPNEPPPGERGASGRRPEAGRPETSRPEGRRPSDDPSDRRGGESSRPPRSTNDADRRGRETPADAPKTGSGNSRGGRTTAATLAGVWRGWVVDGKGENPNAGHMQMELTIEGSRMTAREVGTRRGGDGLGDGTFVVTAAGNSGDLNATGTSGRHDGVEYLGIFELNGDTLKWCVGNRGRPRPQEFSTGRQNYYMILRRENR